MADKENTWQPCCGIMTDQVNTKCAVHPNICPDQVAVRGHREPGHPYLRAENAEYIMNFCPWCGKKIREDEDAESIHRADLTPPVVR